MTPRATATITFFLFACGCLAFGCAAPGDPTARHPVVPTPITDLAARQSGVAIALTFSLPRQSLDHESLAESPSIEVYRAPLAVSTIPGQHTAWRLVYTIPSERVDSYLQGDRMQFRDPLTPEVLASPGGGLLGYMVRTRAAKTRSSADSNYVEAHIYPVPQAPHDIQITVTKTAIELSWMGATLPPSTAQVTYSVFRADVKPEIHAAGQDASQVTSQSPSVLAGVSAALSFPDTHFEFGRTYRYTVRTTAQYGADTVESEDSAPVEVTPRDTFPPAEPAGLEAAIIPVTSGNAAYVELSWNIDSDSDLAGYFVYRSDREHEAGQRVNSEVVPSPTFRDNSVAGGARYFYRVSAVDRDGNESAKSSAVQVDVP
jgi:hypothetical protein